MSFELILTLSIVVACEWGLNGMASAWTLPGRYDGFTGCYIRAKHGQRGFEYVKFCRCDGFAGYLRVENLFFFLIYTVHGLLTPCEARATRLVIIIIYLCYYSACNNIN